ncbi:MAG: hypothetical protein ACI835_004683 [Planctomycetota bacterium]
MTFARQNAALVSPPPPSSHNKTPLVIGEVSRIWWPLAASWLLMGVELPLFTHVVAGMSDPKIHLAAFGSVVFPISLLIEAPIIMLLAASTALCSDRVVYRKLQRFTTLAGLVLTVVHLIFAFTPAFDWLVTRVLEIPSDVVEPARLGMRVMTPWTWAIAQRRFQQGVLIRFGDSKSVSVGTILRLVSNVSTIWLMQRAGVQTGIIVGASGIAVGVTMEALFVHLRTRCIVADRVPERVADNAPLTRSIFISFYVPLAMTPLLTLVIQPLGSWAMSRMPEAIDSLAAWPPVHGLIFLTRGVGMAFNEVVVAGLGRPGSAKSLGRFTLLLASGTFGVLAMIALSPLAMMWFEDLQRLDPEMARLCNTAILIALPMPAYQALQSWFQGALVHAGETRGITEAVALYLVTAAIGLALGVRYAEAPGIYIVLVTFVVAGILQTLYLAWRARPHLQQVRALQGQRASS